MNIKILGYTLLMVYALISSGKSYGQPSVSKHQALFIYNFTKYMQWPENDRITIGVIGNSQVLLELQPIAERNTKISIKKLSGNEGVAECNIVFLPKAQSRNFEKIQEIIGSQNIVLVTEDAALTEKGAEVGFYVEENKLKFIINKARLESTEVKVSQALYAIAKII